jgi:tRNA threonylcarbamoyladenosine biosynthesis protein TsaE
MRSLKIISRSENETISFGVKLAHSLSQGDIVCLFGNLGSGKTILVKGIAEGLGINKNEVISPSFVLIREYLPVKKMKRRVILYHFDLYRLTNPRYILNLGYEEYFYDQGICIIEWADRLEGYLPAEFLKIELQIKNQTQRIIKLIAKGQRYRKSLLSFRSEILNRGGTPSRTMRGQFPERVGKRL